MTILKQHTENVNILELVKKMADNNISHMRLSMKDIHKLATRYHTTINNGEAKFIKKNYHYSKYSNVINVTLEKLKKYREENRDNIPLLPDEQRELLYELRKAIKEHEDMNTYIKENGIEKFIQ